jgi:hypothetical protein
MKKHRNLLLTGLLFVGLTFNQACNKTDSAINNDRETVETTDEALTEAIFDELQEISDQAWQRGTSCLKSTSEDGSRLGDCVTITIDTLSVPRVMTIDFGEANCLCDDGKYRRGQIIVTFTGRFRRPGSVITHTFQNFYVNDNQVQGTKIKTNLGFNADGFLQFRNEENGSITMISNGNVITWNSVKTRTWIEGFQTPRWMDDVYLIEGSSEVSSTNGRSVSRLITNPLRRELSCRYFVSGTVQITPAEAPQRILDYGDGTCDNIATVTIGDRIITITLP